MFVILVVDKSNKVLLNHEKIHIMQQWELLVIGFILFYFGQYLYFRLLRLGHWDAYRELWHEREAKRNENDFNYLTTRELYSFLHMSN